MAVGERMLAHGSACQSAFEGKIKPVSRSSGCRKWPSNRAWFRVELRFVLYAFGLLNSVALLQLR